MNKFDYFINKLLYHDNRLDNSLYFIHLSICSPIDFKSVTNVSFIVDIWLD